jgi:hypothetical protein
MLSAYIQVTVCIGKCVHGPEVVCTGACAVQWGIDLHLEVKKGLDGYKGLGRLSPAS